jgi:hypothetical protein
VAFTKYLVIFTKYNRGVLKGLVNFTKYNRSALKRLVAFTKYLVNFTGYNRMVGFLPVSFRCIGRKKKKWKEIEKIGRVGV